MQYRKICGVGILAGLLAACSSNGMSTMPDSGAYPQNDTSSQSVPGPMAPPGQDPNTPMDASQQGASAMQSQPLPTTNTTVQGQVTALQPGGSFTISNASTRATVPVTVTSQTTVNAQNTQLTSGKYAIVVSNAQSTASPMGNALANAPKNQVNAQYVAVFPTQPMNANVSGTVANVTPFGFDLTTANGSLPVLIDTNSRVQQPDAVAPGATVNVTGTGTTNVAVLAQTVNVTAAAPAAATSASSDATQSAQDVTSASTQSVATLNSDASTIAQKHVLTGDFLLAPGGSESLAPSRAAPHLSWAQTTYANANRVAAAGIKTELYFNPNRISTHDPLYRELSTAGYAHTCSSSRVYETFTGLTMYVTQPSSAAMHSAYASYSALRLRGQHVDAIFEDNAGPLSIYYLTSFHPTTPCSYSDSSWLAGERSLEAAIPYNTIFNALSGYTNHGISSSIGLLSNTKTIGGNLEHCFTDNARAAWGGWVWTAAEDTELAVSARGKLFQCMARRTQSAESASAARTYTIASFLLTYNPAHSLLWEQFGTPSALHVFPESQLVPLSPTIARPSSVSSLLTSTGVYAREYLSCYYAGRLVGRCAMVVNPATTAHTFPRLRYAYGHTMLLRGYGVLDGGTLSTTGRAHSSVMPALSAYVLFQ